MEGQLIYNQNKILEAEKEKTEALRKAIYVHLSYKESEIQISVKDEGGGIPKEKQEQIFERFGQVNNTFTVILPITREGKKNFFQEKGQQNNSRIIQAVETEFSDIYI